MDFCITYFVKMTWERNRENCGVSSFTVYPSGILLAVEWAGSVSYMGGHHVQGCGRKVYDHFSGQEIGPNIIKFHFCSQM